MPTRRRRRSPVSSLMIFMFGAEKEVNAFVFDVVRLEPERWVVSETQPEPDYVADASVVGVDEVACSVAGVLAVVLNQLSAL